MLDAFPIYHWFHNGNPYSGAEGGMRYVITPIKVPDPSDESGKKKREALCAEVWPGPWSIEHTAEEKIETQLFDGEQAGLDKAVAWLHERYTAEADRWTDIIFRYRDHKIIRLGFAGTSAEQSHTEYHHGCHSSFSYLSHHNLLTVSFILLFLSYHENVSNLYQFVYIMTKKNSNLRKSANWSFIRSSYSTT